MKISFIDLHIHTIYSQEKSADLGIKETLDYYQTLGLRSNGRVVIRINDHNTIFGGVDAVEYFLAHRNDYPNLFVIPGIEFSANMGHALKFKNKNYTPNPMYPNSDDKYSFVFKSAHIGAGPILEDEDSFYRWKNNPDLIVFSKLQKMFLDKNKHDGKYYFEDSLATYTESELRALSNVGDQICACKNLIRKYFGVIIPYREYMDCTKDGLDIDEILTKFFDVTCSYLKKHYAPFAKLSKKQVLENVQTVLDKSYYRISHKEKLKNFYATFISVLDLTPVDIHEIVNAPFISLKEKLNDLIEYFDKKYTGEDKSAYKEAMQNMAQSLTIFPNFHIEVGGKRKINIDELCQIVKEAGGIIDFEHPNVGLRYHTKKTYSPSRTVLSIETPEIPTSLLRDIDFGMLSTQKKESLITLIRESGETISLDKVLKYDKTGLIAVQLLRNGLTEQGVTFNNGYIGVEIPKYAVEFSGTSLEKILKCMARNKFLPSVGFDKHLAQYDFYYQLLKDKERLNDYTSMFKDESDFWAHIRNLEISNGGQKLTEVSHFDTYNDFVVRMDNGEYLRLPRVTQTAFCDALLGKKIDFNTSSLLNLNLGASKVIESEVSLITTEQILLDSKKEIMSILYKDLHSYSSKYPQTEKLQEFIHKIAQETKEVVVNLTQEDFDKDENFQSTLGLLITKNRQKLLDAWKKGEFAELTK